MPIQPFTGADIPAFPYTQDEHFDLIAQYENFFPDPLAPKTVLVVPSLSLDNQLLAQIEGHIHYEERLLCMLLLLRMPATQLIYLSSMPIDDSIIDYYLHLIAGVTPRHARKRLHLLTCHDASPQPLTAKILQRPRLISRIRQCIPGGQVAHLTGFNITPLEEALASQLEIPIYGCSSKLSHWGSKSGGRALFRQAGVRMPDGEENIDSMASAAAALSRLKAASPTLRKAVIKLNEGFSGDGNALFSYGSLLAVTENDLADRLQPIALGIDYKTFESKIRQMGGIVEAFVEGAHKVSPSVQCRITPTGAIDIISTHDQLLDQASGQVYLGACFPANKDYAADIAQVSESVAGQLRDKGVIGRFGIDFISVYRQGHWVHYAIEINLRKGGTTHPYLSLQLLTGGRYLAEEGQFLTPQGSPRYYLATDNLQHDNYKTLSPEDLVDLSIRHRLHYDHTTQDGVLFHLIGALPQHGKLGLLCIGQSHRHAQRLYQLTTDVLQAETTDP